MPCEYVGQFQARGDQDWLVFEAKKGQVYTLEVIAKRQRSRTDPEMIIQRVAMGGDGKETVNELQKVDDLATNLGGPAFDTRSDDPLYRFVVPEDGTYRILHQGPLPYGRPAQRLPHFHPPGDAGLPAGGGSPQPHRPAEPVCRRRAAVA